MKPLYVKYFIVLVILVAQGIEESTVYALNVTDLRGMTASNFCHPGSDCEHHLFLEMSSSSSRSVNQAEKVEPVIVARTDSNQSRIKPVNVLIILQNGVSRQEQFSLKTLFHLANPQTFHTRTLINFLRI